LSIDMVAMHRGIIFSGVDGSGKTTLTKLIATLLSQHITVCIHWFRGTHLLASILARFLHRFASFRGLCNPYYKVCIFKNLRRLWIHIEFWSLLPHVFIRVLLRKVCRFLVCDRGFLDFIVWIIVTLNYPSFLRSVYGGFLLRLAVRERPIYLHADLDTLARRADAPREFLARELAVYSVLARYVSSCSINTGAGGHIDSLRGALQCLERRLR